MKRQNRILTVIFVIIICAIGLYGCYYLIQYANGNTPAQIEAQQRMKESGKEMQKTMQEQGNWYKNRTNYNDK